MADLETFEGSIQPLDPIVSKQKEDVARMRTSLLSCSMDPSLAPIALRNITVLRVYHQISRIIRYTELMDKIEDKLYRSIETSMDNMNDSSPATWMQLLGIQEKLQKSMIESHKLLEPYLNLDNLSMVEVPAEGTQESVTSKLFSRDSRDRLRLSAQTVLSELAELDEEDSGGV